MALAFVALPSSERPRSSNVGRPLHTFDHESFSVSWVQPPPPADDRVIARRRQIGENIRAARLRASLTQEAVAIRADLDRASYNRIEQGHAAALIDTLIRIADAIGTPLAHLVRE